MDFSTDTSLLVMISAIFVMIVILVLYKFLSKPDHKEEIKASSEPIQNPQEIKPTDIQPDIVSKSTSTQEEQNGIQKRVIEPEISPIIQKIQFESDPLVYFKLNTIEQPFYLKLQENTDINQLLNEYHYLLSETSNRMTQFKTTLNITDSQFNDVLNSFERMILRGMNQIEPHSVKFKQNFDKADSLEEKQELFFEFLKKSIESNFITPMVGSIIYGIQYGNSDEIKQAYIDFNRQVLEPLLLSLGVKTVSAEKNKPFDFDCYEPLPVEDDSNLTTDSTLKECFCDIRQYAYTFDHEPHLITLGQAIVWRLQ